MWACAEVCIYSYGDRGAEIWWEQTRAKLDRNSNLTVISVPGAGSQALAKLAQRTMRLQCTIQDQQMWMADAEQRAWRSSRRSLQSPPAPG